MPSIATLTLTGKSGREYEFAVYPLGTKFNNIGAVYAITRRHSTNDKITHEVIYIGETEKLGDRIANHEKWPCFRKHNANCICVHPDDDEKSRLEKEKDLIEKYNPPCNK